jgi:hypothetical protein
MNDNIADILAFLYKYRFEKVHFNPRDYFRFYSNRDFNIFIDFVSLNESKKYSSHTRIGSSFINCHNNVPENHVSVFENENWSQPIPLCGIKDYERYKKIISFV